MCTYNLRLRLSSSLPYLPSGGCRPSIAAEVLSLLRPLEDGPEGGRKEGSEDLSLPDQFSSVHALSAENKSEDICMKAGLQSLRAAMRSLEVTPENAAALLELR